MDFEFIVRRSLDPIKAVVRFKLHFDKRGEPDEEIGEESDAAIGKGRVEKIGLGS